MKWVLGLFFMSGLALASPGDDVVDVGDYAKYVLESPTNLLRSGEVNVTVGSEAPDEFALNGSYKLKPRIGAEKIGEFNQLAPKYFFEDSYQERVKNEGSVREARFTVQYVGSTGSCDAFKAKDFTEVWRVSADITVKEVDFNICAEVPDFGVKDVTVYFNASGIDSSAKFVFAPQRTSADCAVSAGNTYRALALAWQYAVPERPSRARDAIYTAQDWTKEYWDIMRRLPNRSDRTKGVYLETEDRLMYAYSNARYYPWADYRV